jgi:periplasmic copper chaperone A
MGQYMKKLAFLMTFLLPSLAFSHAALEQKEVETGTFYKAVLGIGHGCEGASTTKVTIELPAGVHKAKPMPKAGWHVETVKATSGDVKQIVWSGGELLDAHFDEFVFKAKIDVPPQTLYFPTKQECTAGEIYWNDIPAKGKTTHDYKNPAPALKVLKKTTSGYDH